jgi:hypothetical protein
MGSMVATVMGKNGSAQLAYAAEPTEFARTAPQVGWFRVHALLAAPRAREGCA